MRRFVSSLLLAGSLIGANACAVRVYDEPRRDYHRWDGREERAYRLYLGERHIEYRDFRRLNRREQDGYWAWRHNHPDRDRDDRRREDRR